MIRDPFYNEIDKGLQGRLDPEAFEQCAQMLLGKVFPGTVPIRGGTDFGLDGKIPMPSASLIATTGVDVIGNLTRSLNRQLKLPSYPRRCVVATSQQLTPTRRFNLESRARELGFDLLQIFDRAAMANLLYESPEWCVELLNLPGRRPPLSALPVSTRPSLSDELIGRESDLRWLEETTGDRLVVGPPGAGKTSLLKKLVAKQEALFVVSSNIDQIVAGLRKQKPKVVILDDAHGHIELLRQLIHVRQETGVRFSIVASCWSGDDQQAAETLSLTRSSIHCLKLLNRNQMVDVIRSSGIHGPDGLIQEIVVQSEGLAGIAATLCHCCLQGGLQQVALGETLNRTVTSAMRRLVGDEAIPLVATIAAGGEVGLTTEELAKLMNVSLAKVGSTLTTLGAAGIIHPVERGQRRFTVRPVPLRYVLVKDFFFGPHASLDFAGVAALVPTHAAATTVMAAKSYGGSIAFEQLVDWAQRAQTKSVWEQFVAISPAHCRWLTRHEPEVVHSVADTMLQVCPEAVIRLLLEAAIGDNRPHHSHPEHPMRRLVDWVRAGRPGTPEAVRRRRLLRDEALSWLRDGRDVRVGVEALGACFCPGYEGRSLAPGAGDTIQLTWGLMTDTELTEVLGWWPECRSKFMKAAPQCWDLVIGVVTQLAYPGHWARNRGLPPEIYTLLRSKAREILEDMATWPPKGHEGALLKMAELAEELGFTIKTRRDRIFDLLYPPPFWRRSDPSKAIQRRFENLKTLAQRWSKKRPSQVAQMLAGYEARASEAGRQHHSGGHFLCRFIAETIESPIDWFVAFKEVGHPPIMLEEFLKAAVKKGERSILSQCLNDSALCLTAIRVAMTIGDPATEIKESVLSLVPLLGQSLEYCMDSVDPVWIELLLVHPEASVRTHAAIGLWLNKPDHEIQPQHMNSWRDAISNSHDRDHWISDILTADSSLAVAWVLAGIRKGETVRWWSLEQTLRECVAGLEKDQRSRLIRAWSQVDRVPSPYFEGLLARVIVGSDAELYKQFLSEAALAPVHLAPLQGYPDADEWCGKAQLALAHGYRPAEVAHATYLTLQGWTGPESNFWKGWFDRFAVVLAHSDGEIREVGAVGQEIAQERLTRALAEEEREAVYGR